MRETTLHVRIAIADDHQIFRDGLKRLLESEPGFKVVAEAADGVEAARIAREIKPDILLLDVAMPRMGGIETMSAPGVSSTRVILLTAAIEPNDLLRAVRFGARGVVLKESATRDLIAGIHRVMDGKLLIDSIIAGELVQAVHQSGSQTDRPCGLTAREVEIVEAIATARSPPS
jgi:DNA-binding NarL/FixJ family response regulator